MKKPIHLVLLAILLMAAGCSKDDDGSENNNGSDDALVSASTGWQKVGTVPYSASVLGLPGHQAMTPYDLTVVGNELALLYSEDYQLSGVQATNAFKVKFTPGTPVITGSTALQRGGYGLGNINRFIPGTFTSLCVRLANNNSDNTYVCEVGDESGFIAGNSVGSSFPVTPINFYPDGGLTMSVKGSAANGNISDVLSYTYPNAGNFTVIEDQWSLDPTDWVQTSALRLSGGEINQFVVSTEGSKVYFSIIKNDPDYVPTNGIQHNFFMMARQEIPGLAASNFGSPNIIIASNVVNDKYTVLLGEVGNGTHGEQIVKKVHCYQWQKGSTEFTKLYGDIAVPEDVGYNLMFKTPIGTRPVDGGGAPVKFTPDGTVYMLYNYFENGGYTALTTINAGGAKIMGKYSLSDYPNGHYDQVGLAVCEYYNGAYYAVVFQKKDSFYSFDNPKFRMEIVKLVP